MQIPLDDIANGIRNALWSALAIPLHLVTCQQAIFAASAEPNQLSQILPAIRIFTGGVSGQGVDGTYRWDGIATWTVAYNRLFDATMTDDARARALVTDTQQICDVLSTWGSNNTWAIPGYTPPDGVFIRRACAAGMSFSPNPELESDEVKIGISNVQIRVDLTVWPLAFGQ